MRRLGILFSALLLTSGCSSENQSSNKQFSLDDCPSVNEAPLVQCIKQYKLLGISPDESLKECQRSELNDCIKNMAGKNYIANSISKGEEGYLIDLGNETSRWMQGKEWEEKGCIANKKGISRTEDTRLWKWDALREFFRQGWCESDSIELNQPYSDEEAKTRCNLQSFNSIKKYNQILST